MRTLFLLRHAAAQRAGRTISDVDRRLSRAGSRAAREMATRLMAAGAVPQVIISSPAARAVQTAHIFAKVFNIAMEDVVIDELIYERSTAPPDAFLTDIVKKFDDQYSSAMLIGHEPALSELAHYLRRTFTEQLVPGAVVEFEFHNISWTKLQRGRGVVRRFECPPTPVDSHKPVPVNGDAAAEVKPVAAGMPENEKTPSSAKPKKKKSKKKSEKKMEKKSEKTASGKKGKKKSVKEKSKKKDSKSKSKKGKKKQKKALKAAQKKSVKKGKKKSKKK